MPVMKHPWQPAYLITLLCTLASCANSSEPADHKPLQPGMISRALDVFRGSPERIEQAGRADTKHLAISLTTTPETISLASTRRLAVEIILTNNGKETVSLQFPTSQRIEIQILDESGGIITRWSDDRAFAQMLGHVAINPGERVTYQETISLRDLKPGSNYTLEVLIPGYPELTIRKPLRPQA